MTSRLNLGCRGSVAVWLAVMLPGLIMAVSLAVEAGSWEAAQMSVQRAADVSAMAGAMNYTTSASNQKAATFAAMMAQLNGGSGTNTPSWNSGTNTLTDNMITAQVISGYATASDTAIKVTVQKSIPAGISQAFSSQTTHTVTGTGVAELINTVGAGSGGQPCLLALSTTGPGISGSGSTYITMPGCTMRSNSLISFSGSGTLTTSGFYAPTTATTCSYTGTADSICIPSWFTLTGTQYPTSGTITDPYASNTTLQSALTAAAALTGTTSVTCSGVTCTGPASMSCSHASGTETCTLQPGNYGSLSTPGGPYIFNFQPGLYSFSGSVVFSGNTTTNATGGVTIIAAGGFTGENTFIFNLTAPTASQAASTGGIAGIALASLTTTTLSLSGSATYNVVGVTYFPNAQFNASGSSGSSSSPAEGSSSSICTEIIASSIVLSGYSNFGGTCSSYGATSFYSVSGTSQQQAAIVH